VLVIIVVLKLVCLSSCA